MERASINFKFDKKNKVLSDFDVLHIRIGCQTPAPNQGIFPRYAGGRYDFDGAAMIVSRGLARESTRVPRIFNRPEYVVVEVEPEK